MPRLSVPPTVSQVRRKSKPSAASPPVIGIRSPSARARPRASAAPLTARPSPSTSTARSPSRASSRRPRSPPARSLSPTASTSLHASSRSVRSKRAIVTASERSRTAVPWISPALEQPMINDRGYARATSTSTSGRSITSGEPNAVTSVRGESPAGNFALHRASSRSYDSDATCISIDRHDDHRQVVAGWVSAPEGLQRADQRTAGLGGVAGRDPLHDRAQPALGEVLALAVLALRDPFREAHHHVAALDLDLAVGEHGGRRVAERRPLRHDRMRDAVAEQDRE